MPRKLKHYIDSIIEEAQKIEIKEKLSRDFRINLLDPSQVNITNDKDTAGMHYTNFRDPSDDGVISAELVVHEKTPHQLLSKQRTFASIYAIPAARDHLYTRSTGIVYETKLAGISYMIHYEMFNLYYNKTNS